MNAALVGVIFNPTGPIRLQKLYKRILKLSEKIPKESVYRKNLEAIIHQRSSIVIEASGDRTYIENNICSGSLEMLISQAENEYFLLQEMILRKSWEPLVQQPPPGQWNWPPTL